MGFDLLHPILERIKRCKVINRVDHDNAHCTFVISLGDGLKSLLASCIPDLHTDFFAINLYGLDFEVNTLVRENDVPIVVRWDVMKLF